MDGKWEGSIVSGTGSPANKTYQRSASHRDRPYASPYREATDNEVISGRARRIPDGKRTAHDDDGDRFGGDDMSEVSDISAWSVPTKVKQLLQMDNDAGPVSRVTCVFKKFISSLGLLCFTS